MLRQVKFVKAVIAPALTFIIGATLSLTLFSLVQAWEQSEIKSFFKFSAQSILTSLQKDIVSHQEVVNSMAGLFSSSQHVTRKEFRSFVADALSRHPNIQGLSWNPLIKDSERKLFTEKAHEEGFRDFKITQLNLNGQRVEASIRDEYVAVYYIEPYLGNEVALGFDIASHPGRLEAIQQARDAGKVVNSERIRLLQDKDERFGYLLLRAIYRNEVALDTEAERREHFVGVTVGVFRFSDWIPSAMGGLPIAIDVWISDESAPVDKQFLYFFSSRTRQEALQPTLQERMKAENGLHWRTTIKVLGREWSFLFTPAPAFMEGRSPWQAWASLVAGLFITTLLTLYLFTVARHANRLANTNVALLREAVDRRQAEENLQTSDELHRLTLNNISDALFITDDAGMLTYISPKVDVIFGYSVDELRVFGEIWKILGYGFFDRKELDRLGEIQNIEHRVKDKAGKELVMLIHVKKVSIKNGTMLFTCREITDRKRIEEKLGQSAAVVQNTAEGIIITDRNSRIISVNPAFTDITGYSEDEVIGKTPRILKSKRHNREFYAEMWMQIVASGRWQGELWDRKKDGAVFPSWSTISAVVNDDGEVTNYVGVFSDISSLKQSEDKLDFLAYHDPLTNLPNRLLFSDRLDHALRVAKRDDTMLGVLFIDLDRFKNINDSLGHSVGDRLLEQVAIRLQDVVRQEDTVARLGGDEFVVLIEGVNHASDVVGLANKLLSAFNDSFDLDGHTLFVTPSIGASVYPQDGSDSETLIRNADTAMYRAKEMGRNNCYLYSSELTEQAMERLTLESALRNAIQRDEFELNYQPQFELATNKLLGVEALIRWNHPELGQIMPDRFIPVAEESGLIVEIGVWVLRAACEQMQAWQQQGLALNVIAVNVSGVQFQRGDIVDAVASALSESGLPPQCLELEITESIILKRPEYAIDALHKLKQLGISISIDDFGIGYSSLSQLKHLPVDKLKIDQSFVHDIPHDKDDEAIACAVIALGHSMNLKVIAEGVETVAQREFLIFQGCDEGQGYLYSRPVSVARIEELLLAGDLICT